MNYFQGLEDWKEKRCHKVIWHDGIQILRHPDGIEFQEIMQYIVEPDLATDS